MATPAAGFLAESGPGFEELAASDQDFADKKAEGEAMARLGNLPLNLILQHGVESMARLLVSRAMAGTATHQELSVLRAFLKDQGMVMGLPSAGAGLTQPSEPAALPNLPAYQE